MKRKGLWQLLVSFVLILCLLAGCSSSSKPKVDDDTQAPAATEMASETAEADSEKHELVGTLEDITMETITLRLMDGRVLTFNANNVKHSFSYGITEGNWVTVIYSGEIKGTDTSKIAVLEIHDEDTDYVRSVKAQTTIEDTSDTVYPLETVVVRASYMMASEALGTLKTGESVKRTGHCNNGWDRILFKDKEAYVYGSLLTTNPDESGNKGSLTPISKKVKMKELSETVYAKTDATVRAGYSTAAKQIGALKAGASVTRTGICDNGWSRINYNGLVGFVYSDLLTLKNPNSETEGVKITAVNETVFVVKDANVRKSWSDKSDILDTLKAGTNLVRTGICDNGWSRVTYNKQDAYIFSDLLTKKDPKPDKTVKIYKANGYAWTVTKANVRESFTVDSKSLGVLEKGSGIKITGVTDNNWSRVDYNGKVGFIHNDLLTSKDPNPKPAPTPETKATETKAPETKATETKAPETKATETKAPETETKAPETETKAPETETKAPETQAPETETQAPETETQAPETETQAPETETQAPETETAAPETETQAPETETEAPAPQYDIEGIVVGYNIESITIRVEEDSSGSGSESRPAEEPAADPGDGSNEYPSISYSDAKGKELTYYTFDIREASQSFSQGIDEGLVVKVTYTGDLKDMSSVRAVKVTDEGIKQTTKTFRGIVVSYDKDVLMLDCGEGVQTGFNCKNAEVAKDVAAGSQVRVIADMKDAKAEDTVFKAVKVDIEK